MLTASVAVFPNINFSNGNQGLKQNFGLQHQQLKRKKKDHEYEIAIRLRDVLAVKAAQLKVINMPEKSTINILWTEWSF